ncbi:sugar transferase [Granulicella cerasi]|uniref:Sugar transferase n=1 Tax=Granulicella cerasi TaxID=741063 RepID=A0ABW1ZBU2_9BACT|nr:sugar transferase [Granulicella cerasi]
MTTPDYLEQVVVSNRRRRATSGARGEASLKFSATSFAWALLDTLSILVAALLGFRFRVSGAPVPEHGWLHDISHSPVAQLSYLTIFILYFLIFARIYGLYRANSNTSGLHEQRMVFQTTLVAGLLFLGTLYMLHAYEVSRLLVIYTVLFTVFLIALRRGIWRKLRQRQFLEGIETRNVLIVGSGRVGQALRNHLEALPHMGFRFKGFISLSDVGESSADPNVIGNVQECVSLARTLFVDEIFFSTPADKKIVVGVVEEARAQGIDVRVVPDLYDGLAWNAPVEFIGQFPTIPLHRGDFPRGAYMMKRILDVVLSTLLLIVLSPILLAIVIMVRLDSKGPVLYRAVRIGRKGRMFRCFKFRSMVTNADKIKEDLAHLNERNDVLFKITNDPRVTKVGARLRKYSLDELPQLFNVLRGDMSLVGPRPPLASEVAKYEISHLKRLDVLPGMTGLWQVEARQDPSFDSYISLDTAYVENWNLMLDLRILARTIGVVLSGSGS